MKKGFTLIELLIVIAIITILALIAIPNFLEAQVRANVARVQADMRSVVTSIEAYMVDYNTYPIAPSCWDQYFKCNNNECSQIVRADFQRNRVYSNGLLLFTSLSTPIAYISSTNIKDPFNENKYWYHYANGSLAIPRGYHFVNFVGIQKYKETGLGNWKTTAASTPNTWECAPFKLRLNGPGGSPHSLNWALTSCGPDRTLEDVPASTWIAMPTYGGGGYWDAQGSFNTYDPSNGSRSVGNIWRLSDSADPK